MTFIDIIRDITIHRLLQIKARQYGNREFFCFNDHKYSFLDMDRESDQVAAGLQALGVSKGDPVAIIMGNRPEFLFLWFGLSKLGAIEVPINTAHRGALLSYMVNMADCRLLVVESKFLDRVAPVLADLPKLEKIVVLGEEGETLPRLLKPTLAYTQIVDNNGRYDPVKVIWNDPFAIIYTSGTTGPSKGVLLPHNYALHMGEIITHAAEYTDKERIYTVLPLYHGNAQLLATMPALLNGARMLLRERFSVSSFWQDIKAFKCTSFNYVGSILGMLYKGKANPGDASNSLRVMVGGGAPPGLFETIEKRFGVNLIEGYGMTEIGLPLMNTLKIRKPASCGRPLPNYEVKVVDHEGVRVGVDTPGELLVRHKRPYIMMSKYYNMPERTVEAWRDLWFHTGDYLYYDRDGYFHFVDRKKDALRRRGENISSYEVEKIIDSHPAVQESAAVAAVSEVGENEVMVCLVLKPGAILEPAGLIAFCEEHMAYFMIPRYIRFMDKLPRTSTQRVEKYKLRQQGATPDTWDREKAGYKLKK